MSKKEEEAAPAAEGEQPKKKSKKLLFIIIGVVVLLLGAGVPMFLMGGGEKPKEGEEEHVEVEHHLELAELGTFIVNLSEASTFVKTNIKIEYDATTLAHVSAHGDEKGGEAEGGGHSGGGEAAPGGLPAPIKKREPMIRDVIIRILSSKSSSQLLTSDGKDQLKEELLEGINEAVALEEPVVTAVYFNEFIIQ